LDLAKKNYGSLTYCSFFESNHPADLSLIEETFDVFISMETFEHIKTSLVEEYLKQVTLKLKKGAWIFITVPNEIGLPLLIKYAAKAAFKKFGKSSDFGAETYSFKELYYGFLGKTEKVKRVEGGHKGFNWKNFQNLLTKYFDLVKVEGIPFSRFPSLSFQVGLVLKNR